jgi:hypothetical protein
MAEKVAVIILNWEQEADTTECLRSLDKVIGERPEIILVDNGSRDGSAARLKERFPRIKLIANPENVGFAEGNNIGIAEALKAAPDHLLLLNNDTTVEPDFLQRLLAAAASDPAVGIVSPKIMFFQDRQKIWFLGGGFQPVIRKPFHLRYGRTDNGLPTAPFETEWLSGCCLLIRRRVLEQIGRLDKDYFNNYEDVDFCVRAKQAGYKCVVAPGAQIYHKFAASMGGKASPFYTYFRTRNNLLFFRKTSQWFPLVLNLVLFPVYSVALSIVAGKWQSVGATVAGVVDYFRGNYGYGSAGRFR